MRFYADTSDVGTGELRAEADITIDLNGNTFTVSHISLAPSANGKTLTLKNGDVVINGELPFISGVITNTGTVKLLSITLDSSANELINLPAGALEIYSSTVKHTPNTENSQTFRIGNTDNFGAVSLSLYGARISSNAVTLFGIYFSSGYSSEVNVEIGKFEDRPSQLSANKLLSYMTYDNLDSATTLDFSLSDVLVEMQSFVDISDGSDALLWYDSQSGSSKENKELSEANIKYTLSNIHMSIEPELSSVLGSLSKNGRKCEIFDSPVYSVAYLDSTQLGIQGYLTLYNDFLLSICIPKDKDISAVFADGKEIFNVEKAAFYIERDGYYVVPVERVAPNASAKAIDLKIFYNGTAVDFSKETLEFNYSSSFAYSVIDYAENLLSSSAEDEAKSAMKAALAYVDSAYKFFNISDSTVHDAELLEKLATLAETYDLQSFAASYSLTPHLQDVDFDESLGIRVRFELAGTLRLHVDFGGAESYRIADENGAVIAEGRSESIALNLYAYELPRTLYITVGDSRATFSFAEYATELIDQSPSADLENLLLAINAYGKAAAALSAEQKPEGLIPD